MKESEIQRDILDYLRSRGIWAWRAFNGPQIHGNGFFTKTQTPGMPDIQGVLVGGLSLQIEVKKPKGKRSPEQIEWIAKAADLGAVAFFAESVSDVAREINSLLEAS